MICRGNEFALEGVAAGAAGGHVMGHAWLGRVGFEQRTRHQMLFRGLHERIGAGDEITPAKDALPVGRLEHLDVRRMNFARQNGPS